MAQQTAVEWLVKELNQELDYIPIKQWDRIRDLVVQAKQMEKDEMIKFAFDFYYDFCIKTGVPFNLISENRDHVEQYFNETYKK